MLGSPAANQRSVCRGEKEEQRNERTCAAGGGERYGACDDAAGPVIVFGTLASVVYGVVLMLFG